VHGHWYSSADRRKFRPVRCRGLDEQLFRRFSCVSRYVRGASGRLIAWSWQPFPLRQGLRRTSRASAWPPIMQRRKRRRYPYRLTLPPSHAQQPSTREWAGTSAGRHQSLLTFLDSGRQHDILEANRRTTQETTIKHIEHEYSSRYPKELPPCSTDA